MSLCNILSLGAMLDLPTAHFCVRTEQWALSPSSYLSWQGELNRVLVQLLYTYTHSDVYYYLQGPMCSFSSNSPKKFREKKRNININIDLAIFPSHDTYGFVYSSYKSLSPYSPPQQFFGQ